MKYAGVVVDNNTNATDAVYTYRTDIPDIAVGQKVRVPFSVHDRMADGYVVSVSDDPPEGVSRFKNIALPSCIRGKGALKGSLRGARSGAFGPEGAHRGAGEGP